MQNDNKIYDCAIVGGGLAGLCLSIQLSQMGYSVILYEKNKYPFHKVCGEYISNESFNFLESLGMPLSDMELPIINQLGISSVNGYLLEASLKMGGFGISRYTLDNQLALIAKQSGVTIFENCKVNDVQFLNNNYSIKSSIGVHYAKITCGSYGKHNPVFMQTYKSNLSNYIGVKYHIKTNLETNRIELHNFKGGYCGVSKIEDDKYCLCYLTTTQNLKNNNGNIKQLEQNVLMQNPYLKKYFSKSEFLFDDPLTISQITFNKKNTYNNNIFLLGDAAGAIAPLCGNGMSMSMKASKVLAELLDSYYKKDISKEAVIKKYKTLWDKNFAVRIKTGYYLQQLLDKTRLTSFSLKLLNSFPKLLQKLISLTHGKPF